MKVFILVAFVAIFASQVLSQDCTPLRCTLPVKPGDCDDQIVQWYYDKYSQQCRAFFYTGCGGNVNRFRTKQLCENTCFGDRPGCTTSTTRGPTTTTRRTTRPPTQSPLPPRCNLKLDPGNCDKAIPRFYYDQQAVQCRPFNYTGCLGNVNNFGTKELCESTCLVTS